MRWWQILLLVLGLVLGAAAWLLGAHVGLEAPWLRALVAAALALPMPLWFVGRALWRTAEARPVSEKADAALVARCAVRVKKLREVSAAQSAGKAALPWALVVGPAGAGKSLLLKRSRLELPFTTVEAGKPEAELEGYVSPAGTLVELRGQLLTRERRGQAYVDLRAALGTLAGAPIGAVVVVLDLARLVARGEAEVDDQAEEQRVLLEALRDVLGIDPPVLVVLSHADLLEGFVLGFGTMSGDFRAGALGVELGSTPAQEVGGAWGGLIAALRAVVRGTVSRLRPELRRMRLELPEQLAQVGPLVERLVQRLVEPSALGDAARVRGVFVESTHQEGSPQDLVDRLLTQQFGARAADPARLDGRETRSFFAYGALVQVALRPRGVPPSRSALRKRVLLGRAAWAVAVALVLALGVGGAVSFAGNRQLVAEATQQLQAVRNTDATETRARKQAMSGLLALGRLIERLDDHARDGAPLSLRFGLYRGAEVRAEVARVFADRMRTLFERPTMAEVQEMFAYPDRAPQLLPLYDLLTAYLMVTEQRKELDVELAARALGEVWGRALPPEVIGERERVELVRHYVRLAGDATLQWERIDSVAVDTVRSVMKASGQQRRQNGVELQRLVLSAVTDGEDRVPDKRLSSFVTTARSVMFEQDVVIAAPFTLAGYRALRDRLTDTDRMRPWVLGHSSLEAMQAQLEADYHAAFLEAWTTFLRGLKWTGGCSGGAESAKRRLLDVTEGDSLFVTLTRRVREEASFPSASEEAGGAVAAKLLKGKNKAAAGDALEADIAPAEKALAPWLSLVDGEPAPLAEYKEKLAALAKAIDKDMAEPGKHVEDRRRAVDTALETAERITAAMGNNELAQVWRPLLLEPIQCASSSAQQAGRAALQAGFAAAVCGPFNDNLLGRYPFAQSDGDASVAAVEELFGPGGLVWAYYNQSLKDELVPVGERIELRPGASGTSTPEMARFYTQAYTLCRALFTCAVFTEGAAASAKARRTFLVSPEAPTSVQGGAVNVTAVVLEAEKKTLRYGMGQPVEWRLEWPFDGARLWLDKSDSDGRFELAATGPWALFRVMDRAKSTKPVGDGVTREATFEALGYRLKLQVKVAEGRLNPLFDLRTLRGMTCPSAVGP